MGSACPTTADAFEVVPVESVAHSRFIFYQFLLFLLLLFLMVDPLKLSMEDMNFFTSFLVPHVSR